jgi:type I restriction enzyme S subunit
MTIKLQTYPKYKPSDIDWLGDIPIGWEARKLKYISHTDTSGIFGDEMVGDVEAKLVTTGQLSMSGEWYWEKMESRFFSKSEYKKFKNIYGDVVVVKSSGSSTNIVSGKAGFVSEKEVGTVFGNFLLRIRALNIVKPKFLYYFLTSHLTRQRIQLMCSSTTYPNLKVWEYVSALILLPPIETQKRIADFLDEKTKIIDELIEKKERLIELLREKRAALITRVVTRGLNPKAKMKPSGIDWLGDIPTGWEVKKIKHVTSANKKSLSEDSTDPNYEFDYVDIGNVNNEGKILELQNYFFANAPARARRLAENGDVIISTVRTYLRSMARIKNAKGLVFSTGFAIFHPTKILASQLYWSMQSETFLTQVMANSTGVNYPGINEQKLSSISLPIPSEQEQKQIADFLDTETAKIDKAAALIESQIEKLKEYRSSLIYSAVTGKIKV